MQFVRQKFILVMQFVRRKLILVKQFVRQKLILVMQFVRQKAILMMQFVRQKVILVYAVCKRGRGAVPVLQANLSNEGVIIFYKKLFYKKPVLDFQKS